MRRADVYLRRGKVFAVGMKGTGGVFYEDSSPLVGDATSIDSVVRVLQGALEASVIPAELPTDLHRRRSALPPLAGVKNDSSFNRGASLCIVRQHDDRIELLRGEIVGGGAWRARLTQTLSRETSPVELAEATLRVLQEE